uniref:asparagine synthase-related protein n=1 Tax=Pedobacter sp. TaxID=1411316 RepID=UPI00159A0A52|nr:asparagine synthase-related protein [Pedobacter sp.]QJS06273.1 asparagine synthase [Pedobacter sp.]
MNRFLAKLQTDGDLVSWGTSPVSVLGLLIYFKGYISNKSEFSSDIIRFEAGLDENVACLAIGYSKWGVALTKHIFGEFAIAIYDTNTETLLLAQDCLGIQSLYYRVEPSGVSFSSFIDDLTQELGQSDLNEHFIADYLCYGDHHGEHTPFKAISRLTPGISVQFYHGAIRKFHTWAFDQISPIHYTNLNDYKEELEHLLAEGVKAALPTKGVAMCEVSGGLDSSTVACIASRYIPIDRLHALSYVYSESIDADESFWSKIVVDAYGMTWHRLDVDSARPFTELPTKRCGQPYHTLSTVALNRAYGKILSENNISVVLSGAGGDGVLFGDAPEPFYLADMFQHGQLFKTWKGLYRWAKESPEPRPILYWWNRCVATASVRKSRNLLIQDQPPRISWFASDYLLAANRNGEKRKTWVPDGPGGVGVSWYLERVMRSARVTSLREYSHDMTAEFRHPLMYLPLVKFMCSIPWELKFSPSQDRLLHRQALTKLLPEQIVKRNTKGTPSQAVYTGFETGQWWKAIRSGSQMTKRGYLDSEQWVKAVDLARLGRCESIMHFKAAATMEVWLENLHHPSGKEKLTKSISHTGNDRNHYVH